MSEKVTIEVSDLGKVSDGYHTIGELYEHRIELFLTLAKFSGSYWKEDPNTPGWLIVYIEAPIGQISYHIPEKGYRAELEKWSVRDDAHEWDGHSSQNVLCRLGLWRERY